MGISFSFFRTAATAKRQRRAQTGDNVVHSQDVLAKLSSESWTEYSSNSSIAAAKPMPPAWTVTPEQAAAVSKYVSDFHERGRYWQPHIHIPMFGISNVGRNSLLVRFISDCWLVGCDPQKGGMFHMNPRIDDKIVRIEGCPMAPPLEWSATTWPGQQSPYYTVRHCEACMLVYDVTSRESFEAIRLYYDNICLERSLDLPQIRCSFCDFGDCPPRQPLRPIFVIANKIDSDKAEWRVSMAEGQDFCASIGAIFMPMSVKTGEGSGSKVLLEMTNLILYRRIQNMPRPQGETIINARDSKVQASHDGTRLSRCWSTITRRHAQNSPQLQSDEPSDDKVSEAASSHLQGDSVHPNYRFWT